MCKEETRGIAIDVIRRAASTISEGMEHDISLCSNLNAPIVTTNCHFHTIFLFASSSSSISNVVSMWTTIKHSYVGNGGTFLDSRNRYVVYERSTFYVLIIKLASIIYKFTIFLQYIPPWIKTIIYNF